MIYVESTLESSDNNTFDAKEFGISADLIRLLKRAASGKLDLRADLSKHQRGFRTILEGMNDVLDAIVDPIEVTANYIDRISSGEIPKKIMADYRGDFNKIKVSLNPCIDALTALPRPPAGRTSGSSTTSIVSSRLRRPMSNGLTRQSQARPT